MDTKKTYIIGTAAIILATTIISVTAQKPKEPKIDEVEFLLQKSKEQIKKATKMAKAIDKSTTEKVVAMEESIQTLQEEKLTLTTQLNEVKAIIDSAPVAATPFELESDGSN
jgi:hypothetical protein